MEVNGKRFVVLYLTDWQMRMVKNCLGVDCEYWTVPIDTGVEMRYGVGLPDDPAAKRMYLTEWQKREIMEGAGESCNYIELAPGVIPKYGVPAE